MLRFLSALLAVTVVAFIGIGLILPTTWEAKRTATFETTPGNVADIVGDLATWPDWSHLSHHVDKDTEVSVQDGTLTWTGGEVLGSGSLSSFTTTDGCATYALSSGEAASSGEICWAALPSDDPEAAPKTGLTWSETGESDGGPLVRWYGFLSVDAALGARFEEALGRLEELAEAEPEAEPEPEPDAPSADDDDSAGTKAAGDDDDSAAAPDSLAAPAPGSDSAGDDATAR